MAADQGHSSARMTYDAILGEGDSQSPSDVEKYLRAAAEKDPECQYQYGCLLRTGKCGKVSFTEAAAYFKKAADQGHARAQFNYGVCLHQGEGVAKNVRESMRYYKLSADQGPVEDQF